MKKFLIRIIAFGAFFLLCLFSFIFLEVMDSKSKGAYLDEYGNKIERLRSLEDRKIVIIGGSNTAFGIDSKMIEDTFGMPVANHGLSLSLGLEFALNDAKAYCRKGDILLIIPEYENFYQFAHGGNGGLSILLALYPEILMRCSKENLNVIIQESPQALDMFTSALLESFLQKSAQDYTYNKFYFNCYGDEERHWSEECPETLNLNAIVYDFDKKYVEEFVAEIHKLRESGIETFLIPPSIYIKFQEENADHINELQAQLKCCGERFVIPPDFMVFSRDEMFDSYYHLNRKGTHRRTVMIIDFLKKVLKTDS